MTDRAGIDTKMIVIYGAFCVVLLAIMMIAVADDLARVKRAMKPRLVWVRPRDIAATQTAPGVSQGPSDTVWEDLEG